jgi:hypothetical protein
MRSKRIQKLIDELKQLQGDGDTEGQHGRADDILCEILVELGYIEAVEEWKKVNKWYS